MSLNLYTEEVSARWRTRNQFMSYQDRICKDGMIAAGIRWPDTPFDWEIDFLGEPWVTQNFSVIIDGATTPLIVDSYAFGPNQQDPIEGVAFEGNFWVAHWDDLSLGTTNKIDLRFDQDPPYTGNAALYDGPIENCTIEDTLPAPSMYMICNDYDPDAGYADTEMVFPADISIVDMDVMIDRGNMPFTGILVSPEGTSVLLFSDDTNSVPMWFDDEPEVNTDSEVLPVEPLSNFDGELMQTKTNEPWQLLLTDEQGNPYPSVGWCISVAGYRTVRFASDNFQVSENSGTASILVELSEPSTAATTVNYSTVVGSGSNQQPQSGSLTFLPGEESKPITIQITYDLIRESNESILITLSSPVDLNGILSDSSNQYGLSSPDQATLTIIDNDANISNIFLPAIVNGSGTPQPQNPFSNPGFESGPVGWLEYSALGYSLILNNTTLPLSPHNGSWAAWLGGDHNEISYIEQQIIVPVNNPTLSYWHYISSEDVCGYDVGGVVVNNSTVVAVYDLCESANTNGWVQKTVDLSAYAGQTIDLQIRVETDSSFLSSLYVDDVSFQSSTVNLEELLTTSPTVYPATVAQKKASGLPTGYLSGLLEGNRLLQTIEQNR